MDDKRTLDELIAALNEMRGRMDILRRLADALIDSHPEPKRLADEWFRSAPEAANTDPALRGHLDAIDTQIRTALDDGKEAGG
jgi:hypothetical protein